MINEGDMVFLGRPKNEPKTARDREEQIVKLKHLIKSTGPLIVTRAYHDEIDVEKADAEIPIPVNRFLKPPPKMKLLPTLK